SAVGEASGDVDLVGEGRSGGDRRALHVAVADPPRVRPLRARAYGAARHQHAGRARRPGHRLEEGDASAHVGPQLVVRVLDLDLDSQRPLLAVDLRVQLHHVRAVATVGIGVGHDLGALSDPDLRQLRLGDVDLAPQVVEVGHADQVAGAGKAAG